MFNEVKETTYKSFDSLKNKIEIGATKTLSIALFKDDKKLINTTLKNLTSYSFIHSITLKNTNNEVVAYTINDDFNLINIDEVVIKELPIYNHGNLDSEIGVLVIHAKNVLLGYPGFLSLTKALFVSIFFFIAIALILFLVFKSLKGNVLNMSSAMKQLASGKKGIRYSNYTNIKEIQEFSNAFNTVSIEREKAWNDIEYKEQVFELKKNILQIAAHELNSPLGSIKTLLDIAIHHSINNRKNDVLFHLKKAFSEIDTLNKHIIAILSLSALENNTLTRSDDWIDIQDFFNDLDKQFSVKCKSKNLIWECVSKSVNNKDVYLDYDLVTIIISNAIDNAIKFTKKGHVTTIFEITDRCLSVVVHDSGVGLSKEEIDILQNSPNQLQNNIQRKIDGWGIGLSTMYKFTTFLGGNINFDSKKGFGTKVTIIIPVKSQEKAILHTPIIKLKDSVGDGITDTYNGAAFSTTYVQNVITDGLKIMIVDNNVNHLQQMEELFSPRFLNRDDVEITFCSVSSDAIRLVEETQFDILFIDYHMPGIDGLQFLRFINEHDNKCKKSIKYIITADANISIIVKNEMMLYCKRIIKKGLTSNDVKTLIRSASLKAVS